MWNTKSVKTDKIFLQNKFSSFCDNMLVIKREAEGQSHFLNFALKLGFQYASVNEFQIFRLFHAV